MTARRLSRRAATIKPSNSRSAQYRRDREARRDAAFFDMIVVEGIWIADLSQVSLGTLQAGDRKLQRAWQQPHSTGLPAHVYFIVGAVFHYLGPAFAVLLFARLHVLGVAWLRIASAALVFASW
jgi:hypothetical protein